MSAWTDLGLPLPNAKGYDYARDVSIIRNTFTTALPDQDQLYTNWRKTIEVSWNLTLDQIALAEDYLLTNGYSWFELELVTNETPFDETISLHNVRLISNYKVSPIGGQLLKLNATLETKVIPQTCNQATCVIDLSELESCDYIPLDPNAFIVTLDLPEDDL